MKSEIDAIYELFLERVADGRELERDAVDAVGQGRVWTGAQAHELGLVDALGGLSDAILRAKEELDLDPDADVALVPYPPPKTLAEQLAEAMRGVSVAAAPELPLPQVVLRAREWIATLSDAGPALLPPFVFEIR